MRGVFELGNAKVLVWVACNGLIINFVVGEANPAVPQTDPNRSLALRFEARQSKTGLMSLRKTTNLE